MKHQPTNSLHSLGDELSDAATNLRSNATDSAEKIQDYASDTWDKVRCQTENVIDRSTAYVRKNPVPAVMTALGSGLALGFALGLILVRREPASLSERYIDAPLHRSRGILLGLVVALGALLRRSASSASSAAEELAENINDQLH